MTRLSFCLVLPLSLVLFSFLSSSPAHGQAYSPLLTRLEDDAALVHSTQYQHRWSDDVEMHALRAMDLQQQQRQQPQQQVQQPLPAQPMTVQRLPALHSSPELRVELDRPAVLDRVHRSPLRAVLGDVEVGDLDDFQSMAMMNGDELDDDSVNNAATSTTTALHSDSLTHDWDVQGNNTKPPYNSTLVRRIRAACNLRCEEKLMDVTGQGRVGLPSSRALIHATIEHSQDLATSIHSSNLSSSASIATLHSLLLLVYERTANSSTVVINYLRSSNLSSLVQHLHTSSVSVTPVFVYKEGQQLQKGYRASLSISLSVNGSAASTILSGMLDRGVTRIDGVGYEAADGAVEKARKEAIRRAVKDALDQATTAVTAMTGVEGVEIEERPLQVISLHVIGVTVPSPVPPFFPGQLTMFTEGVGVRAAAVAASLPLLPEEKTITASVLMKVRF